MDISVYVPSPTNQWFETQFNPFSLYDFTNINVPIANFVSATINLVPTVTMDVSGPAYLGQDTFTFEVNDHGEEYFTLSGYAFSPLYKGGYSFFEH